MTGKVIHVDHIARIEGHGNIHVEIADGQVKTVEMEVSVNTSTSSGVFF